MIYSYLMEHNRYCGFIGIAVILGIAWLCSLQRNRVNWKLIFNGLLLHAAVAILVLRTPIGNKAVAFVASLVTRLYDFAQAGTALMFGNLVNADGPWGFMFAVKVLPVIIFFGAFMAILFYFGIVQRFVAAINYVIRPILGTSGAETLCAVSNSFLGQTEAPLLIKPYLKDMTRSEMLVVMVSGMATISGGILVVFALMGVPVFHLLASSVMAIPASLIISKILLPETEQSKTAQGARLIVQEKSSNMFDAIASGTSDGLQLALNVGGMLISFLALLAMLNAGLVYCSSLCNVILKTLHCSIVLPPLTLDLIFSYLFAPFGYLLGFCGQEALRIGQLLGTKVAVNELIAYSTMGSMQLSERAINIMTYALCGFSNFSCIGIQIGGIGALVPEKRGWITQLGLYAVLGGMLSNLLSAMVATILL